MEETDDTNCDSRGLSAGHGRCHGGAVAQNSAGGQGAAAQAQTHASASASANASQQQQSQSGNRDATKPAASTSASGDTSASAGANGSSINLANGTNINAALVTPLDAKHNKPGDEVVARTTQDVKQNGEVLLKKGTRLTGHVTQTQARSSGQAQSTLGVVFESAVPKNGQPVPLKLSVQALAAAATQSSAALDNDHQAALGSAGQAGFAGAAAPSGGLVRGVGNTVGGVASTAGGIAGNAGNAVGGTVRATNQTVASAGNRGGLNAAGALTSSSSGVFGLEGLDLASAASNATQASVVSSATQNVHLASGTQMVLQVMKQ